MQLETPSWVLTAILCQKSPRSSFLASLWQCTVLSGSCTHDKQRRNLLRKDCQILHGLQRSSGCLQDIWDACDEDHLPMIWDSAANSYAARLMVGDVCCQLLRGATNGRRNVLCPSNTAAAQTAGPYVTFVTLVKMSVCFLLTTVAFILLCIAMYEVNHINTMKYLLWHDPSTWGSAPLVKQRAILSPTSS